LFLWLRRKGGGCIRGSIACGSAGSQGKQLPGRVVSNGGGFYLPGSPDKGRDDSQARLLTQRWMNSFITPGGIVHINVGCQVMLPGRPRAPQKVQKKVSFENLVQGGGEHDNIWFSVIKRARKRAIWTDGPTRGLTSLRTRKYNHKNPLHSVSAKSLALCVTRRKKAGSGVVDALALAGTRKAHAVSGEVSPGC